jgi:hypothetical protein
VSERCVAAEAPPQPARASARAPINSATMARHKFDAIAYHFQVSPGAFACWCNGCSANFCRPEHPSLERAENFNESSLEKRVWR